MIKNNFIKVCLDCGNFEKSMDYMVKNEVWKKSGAPKEAYLCLECLDIRLKKTRGHELQWDDFDIDLPINSTLKFVVEHNFRKYGN